MSESDVHATVIASGRVRVVRLGSLTSDDDDDDDSVEIETDQDVLERASLIEQQLYSLVDDLSTTNQVPDDDNDSNSWKLEDIAIPTDLPINAPHAYPCASTFLRLPSPPSLWPQAPVMIRPTPGSDTRIRGIRFADSNVYQDFPGFCAGCILPVNNGHEKPGKSLVVDFETPIFVGTLLARIRGAKQVGSSKNYDTESYFDGKKRTFQVLVKGRFKLPANNSPGDELYSVSDSSGCFRMSEFVTGQAFERPAGKLPAQWIISAMIRLISSLAPQLEACFGNQPRFLTPLLATAHVVQVKEYTAPTCCITQPPNQAPGAISSSVHTDKDKLDDYHRRLVNYKLYAGASDMESDLIEPDLTDPTNILCNMTATSQSINIPRLTPRGISSRRAVRKKYFNAIAAQHEPEPVFDLEMEYCFEFYQHMLILTDADDLKIVAPSVTGPQTMAITQTLNGQPLKILGARKDPVTGELAPAWSFDLWHQALYPFAKAVLAGTE